MTALVFRRITKAMAAVIKPPRNSTSPADQIANAFHVAHDARNQFAGFVRIVVGDGQATDVSLNALAHIGNHALRGFGKQLGQRKRSNALNNGGTNDD